jgi:hypothetical protein
MMTEDEYKTMILIVQDILLLKMVFYFNKTFVTHYERT